MKNFVELSETVDEMAKCRKSDVTMASSLPELELDIR
jgi:hypothetical protein